MAYNWTDGELITAEKLNSSQGGALIVNSLTDESDTLSIPYLSANYKEIMQALNDGRPVYVVNRELNYARSLLCTIPKDVISHEYKVVFGDIDPMTGVFEPMYYASDSETSRLEQVV